MKIEKNKLYKIKGKSSYFKKKYGTHNPEILIEDEDINLFGCSWKFKTRNPACMLYGMRAGTENLPISGKVYYGKIGALGELVHKSELE